MSDTRTLELLSAAADGALTPAQRAELDALLQTSASARQQQADFGRMESLLRNTPPLAPPPGLRARILARLPARGKKEPALQPDWLRNLLAGPVVRYGLAMTAGVLLTVSVYESQQSSAPWGDITELVGTMAPATEDETDHVVASHRFHADGAESRVQLTDRNGALILDIRVDATSAVDIAVDFSAAGMELDAVAQLNGAVDSIEISERVLRLRVHGRRTVTALLHDIRSRKKLSDPTIRLAFTSNDEHQTRDLRVPKR